MAAEDDDGDDAGCCTACRGTGHNDDPSTSGMCPDCYATGHTHPDDVPCEDATT